MTHRTLTSYGVAVIPPSFIGLNLHGVGARSGVFVATLDKAEQFAEEIIAHVKYERERLGQSQAIAKE